MARKRYTFFIEVYTRFRPFLRFIYSCLSPVWKRCFTIGLCLLTMLFVVSSSAAFSQESIVNNVFENSIVEARQAEVFHSRQQYQAAIKHLNTAIKGFRTSTNDLAEYYLAASLTNLGRLKFALGQPAASLQHWQEAITLFDKSKDYQNEKRLAQVYTSRAYLELGLFRRACGAVGEVVGYEEITCDQLTVESKDVDNSKLNQVIGQLQNQDNPKIQVLGLQSLGDILRANGDLSESLQVLKTASKEIPDLRTDPDSDISLDHQSIALQLSLGNTYYALGNLERDRQSSPIYDYQPWRFIETDDVINFQLCKDSESEPSCYERAIDVYKSVSEKATASLRSRTQLNLLSLLIDAKQYEDAYGLLPDIDLFQSFILEEPSVAAEQSQPASQANIYAQLQLSKSIALLKQWDYLKHSKESQKDSLNADFISWKQLIQKLERLSQSLEKASGNETSLSNLRTRSYVLGNLGGLYELCSLPDIVDEGWENPCKYELTDQELSRRKAKQFTEKALLLAQPGEFPDIAYQWQWQLGRLAAVNQHQDDAIENYKSAVNSLELARNNIRSINIDIQFSFRDNLEPVYRQLVDLVLKHAAGHPSTDDLKSVIHYIDGLKVAELENLLECRLENNRTEPIDLILEKNKSTILIYYIVLKDRLEIITKTHKNTPAYYPPSYTTRKSLQQYVNDFQELLVKNRPTTQDTEDLNKKGTELYEILIQPIEQLSNVEFQSARTLVFVLDDPLRKTPMGALYDSKNCQYLIQNKAVALSTSLTLPSSRRRKHLNVLLGRQNQPPNNDPKKRFGQGLTGVINGVIEETDNVQKILLNSGIADSKLLDENTISKETISDEISSSSYNVVHLATHGNFSSDPEDTFIVVKPEQNITLREFDDIFQSNTAGSIELLVLSGCQTGKDDRRAVLGLSGITVRAGVRTSLGTLWRVKDRQERVKDRQVPTFMELFYTNLVNPSLNRAEALQVSQKFLIENKDIFTAPRDWAPYIMVGNWQEIIDF